MFSCCVFFLLNYLSQRFFLLSLSSLVFPWGLIIRVCNTFAPNRKPRKSCLVSGFCKNLKLGTGFIKSFLEVDKRFSKFCVNLGWIQSQPEPISFLAGKIVTYDGCVWARWFYIKMGDFGWIWLWMCWLFPPTGTKRDAGLVEFYPLRFQAGTFVCHHLISQAECFFIQHWTFPPICFNTGIYFPLKTVRINLQLTQGLVTKGNKSQTTSVTWAGISVLFTSPKAVPSM